MHLFKLAACAFPLAVANAITIIGPSESAFWVQNATNTITWQFSPGDPSPINIQVINPDNRTLNGEFAIASFVNISQETVTVTNVTLRPGDGYQVQFVNTTNNTQVFATSPSFTVKPPGSAAAPTVTPSNTASAPSGTATSPSNSTSGTATGTGAASQTGGAKNGAVSLIGGQGVLAVLAACGLASLSALLL